MNLDHQGRLVGVSNANFAERTATAQSIFLAKKVEIDFVSVNVSQLLRQLLLDCLDNVVHVLAALGRDLRGIAGNACLELYPQLCRDAAHCAAVLGRTPHRSGPMHL